MADAVGGLVGPATTTGVGAGVGAGAAVVVGGAMRPQPLAALAPPEAAPMPAAVIARTASPAAKRAPRFGLHEVPFFVDFMFRSLTVCSSGERLWGEVRVAFCATRRLTTESVN
jgi:hypothetical protein